MTEQPAAFGGESSSPLVVRYLCQIGPEVLGAAVRGANMNEPAVNVAVRSDGINPRLLAGCQLAEPASDDKILRQPGELRIGRGQRFQELVINDWLLGLGRPLRRHPAARLEQGPKLRPRVDVLGRRKLLAERRRKHGPLSLPIRTQLLGCADIKRHAVTDNPIADGGDGVLELERRLRITVRSQELPERLIDGDVAGTAGLNFRRPFGPVLELGADLRQTETDAPCLEAVLSEDLAESCVLRPLHDLAVKAIEVRQD